MVNIFRRRSAEPAPLPPTETVETSLALGEIALAEQPPRDEVRADAGVTEVPHHAEREHGEDALSQTELAEVIVIAHDQMQRRVDEYDGGDTVVIEDMKGDVTAFYRLQSLLIDEPSVYILEATKGESNLSVGEMLDRVVDKFASYTTENFPLINSEGGSVEIPEDGVIHRQGYNGSLLYEFARAKQLYEKLENTPDTARTTIIDASAPDASWLWDEPVVVQPVERSHPAA